ncbi:MAG: carbon-nitrogen hydrolase [Planctomycetota bacterium]
MASASVSSQGLLRIGLLQHACPPSNTVEQNRQRTAELAKDAVGQGATLIVTQELFDGPYFPQVESDTQYTFAEDMPGTRTEFLGALAKELGVFISGSCFERRAPGLYHNRTVMIAPDGSFVSGGSYRKMHIPDDPRFFEKYYFAPGDGPTPGTDPKQDAGWCVVEHDQLPAKVGQLVCWDQWYPEAARCTALLGAQVLLYPTAIAWHKEEADDENQRQRDAWITIQRSHAIANGCFVCAINRTGVEDDLTFWGSSFVAAPGGHLIAEAPVDEDCALVADLDLALIETNRQGWPFFRDRRVDAYAPLLQRMCDG